MKEGDNLILVNLLVIAKRGVGGCMKYKEHDQTKDTLLMILTLLLAVTALGFYPLLRMFPFWDIWIFIYCSIEVGFILILIFWVRSTVKSMKVFFIISNTLCIVLNFALIYFYMFPRSIA